MAAPEWDLFAGIALLVVVVMLGLARATQTALSPDPGASPAEGGDIPTPAERTPAERTVAEGTIAGSSIDTRVLLVNVALSHGLLGSLLVAGAWYSRIPASALGLAAPGRETLAAGVGLGVALWAASELSSRLVDASGLDYDESLRELLAPETALGWVVLLGGVLPIIAGVEELLFRAALIGALSAGYGLPAWGLAAVSSILFGLGHGLQGRAGILVTTVLGFALAAAFVATGSLFTAIVAHYLVNALEFLVHEGPW